MTIEVSLSTESIQRAIRELQTVQDNIEREMGEVIDTLTQEGADVARQAIGSMAAVDHVSIGNEGMIEVTGKGAVFQEFGAGQAVMPYLFENPDVKEAGVNPLLHYLVHGKKEGPFRETGINGSLFSDQCQCNCQRRRTCTKHGQQMEPQSSHGRLDSFFRH